ncbi:MAG: 16S rRNA (cytosine(1402)-N(4))-methyltransferase [Microcystis viridis Mv_BB_P_19951000_S69]|uniref:Ribosomal RNA small subunit methyltransferase H n=1 Tax=Microcystis viridis Mv_BB_P_19951000_S68D TaxID=2486270 RepID=A0A552IAA3_MICVR|nr:MAG: 16S rRNA (cytosine(1402)-N(4))-methyltransferase [Microcystis viridis Mv_BB_P_19951000_S69]TRU78858.1 MAG: 16S rRNA (cytosine(1402)-N(4))-methyltransferase [Microcystis viridis Mv_BB_P_19951000_S68]TRU80395.1 MAG: 16S rRNA (cytosine(1402)-N(4))-methyltransferase [Microcystis viridis Mv_BB_P_19951000_S68D]TRU86341.1 MAG: 16S rRNA (cytosine(1402)-N(4))-methyltransferase [Microcystis viridis Mv_BB_P_19951000_S69D]
MNQDFPHISVLSQELIAGLNIQPGGHYLDLTLGGGGHSRLLLETDPETTVTAIDRDQSALEAAKISLAPYLDSRLTLWWGNFAHYNGQNSSFDGIIADLGVSSPQFDQSERGFSFRHTAALDMRMDRCQSLTAADIINHWQEKELADLFYQYGEERLSRPIARSIVQKRPFTTTTELAAVIASSVPASYRYGRIHPATRVFQSLRIAVNQELDSLQKLLNQAPHWLKSGGIIAMISFHSLEDRLIKYGFRENNSLKIITKKPIIPSREEQAKNPRSRSAKLRIAQKIESEVV